MKHFRLAIFLLALLSLTACETQKQFRTVSCNKGMPDSYPIGTMCTTDTCYLSINMESIVYGKESSDRKLL